MNEPGGEEVPAVLRRPAGIAESTGANRRWWDASSAWYQGEHGEFLRDAGFVWCPEGLDEADARLLGDVEEVSWADRRA